MKRPVVLVTLAVVLLGVFLLGISDTSASVANTGIPDANTSNVLTEAERSGSNSSATATITITMTTASNE